MTKISAPVKREAAVSIHGRPLIIELNPRQLVLRLKGTRQSFQISYEDIWDAAIKAGLDVARIKHWLARKAAGQ